MNAQKLKGRIVEVCGSQKVLAERLGVTETTVNNKINGKTGFSIEDVANWCAVLGINGSEVADYFFTELL